LSRFVEGQLPVIYTTDLLAEGANSGLALVPQPVLGDPQVLQGIIAAMVAEVKPPDQQATDWDAKCD